MSRLAVAAFVMLALSGCTLPEPSGNAPDDADGPEQRSGPDDSASAVAARLKGAPAKWWTLSLEAAPEGAVASFAWPIPADAKSNERPMFDLVPQAVGSVSAWTFMAAQDLGDGMELGAIAGDWPSKWVRTSFTEARTVGNTSGDPMPTRAMGAADTWEGHDQVWLIVTATGTGRLDLAFRVTDPASVKPDSPPFAHGRTAAELLAEFAATGTGAPLTAEARALGAKMDSFVQAGTLANAQTPTGGFIHTSWTEGIAISGNPDLAPPAAHAGHLELNWSAPWARWGQVSWVAHDNLGGMVIDYDMAAGGMALQDTLVASGTYFGNIIDYPYASLAGDGAGARMRLQCTMAAGGDYLVLAFEAMALGASLADLTGVPAAKDTVRPQP